MSFKARKLALLLALAAIAGAAAPASAHRRHQDDRHPGYHHRHHGDRNGVQRRPAGPRGEASAPGGKHLLGTTD